MDSPFLESYVNQPPGYHRVNGYRLQPLTLWHVINLDLAGLPWQPGAHLEPAQLEHAARICSLHPGRTLRDIITRRPFRLIRTFPGAHNGILARARIEWQALRWTRHHRAQYNRWRAYLRDYVALPMTWDPSGPRLKSHWTLLVVARLMHLGGLTEESAWCKEFGAAMNLQIALCEAADRQVNIIGDDDIRDLQAAGHDVEKLFGAAA